MKKRPLKIELLKTQQEMLLEKESTLHHMHNNRTASTRKQINAYTKAIIKNNKHKRIQIILAGSTGPTPENSNISQAELKLAELIGCQIAHDFS